MPAVATLRTPDLAENNPSANRDRFERLRDFVNKQCNRRVSLIAWVPAAGATTPDQGAWAAWFDRPAPAFSDPLAEVDVEIAP